MAISPFESAIYRELLRDSEIGQLFTDTAEIVAWLHVEGALARAQGELGIIPKQSAAAIAKACGKTRIDPASLAAGTGRDGIPIPALVAALRKAIGKDEHSGYLHFGATTQDIIDTALVLRLRAVCTIFESRLKLALGVLADFADAHAELPMAARTRRQPATPTSFGAVAAAWGTPLIAAVESLEQLRPRLLRVSLYGAAGNSAALGPRASELRAAVAAELNLETEDACWHSDRSALAEFASLLTRITGALAKIAEDCLFMSAPEVGELRLGSGGGSSTLPHKQNPVQAETILGLFDLAAALDAAMTRTLLHRQQRDGAAWMLEWHALPQICAATGRALQLAISLLTRCEPDSGRMRANLEGRHGLVYAEAIAFRLADKIPRPKAQAAVRQLCSEAVAQDRFFLELVCERFPDIDLQSIGDPASQLGDAPAQARGFVAGIRAL